MEKVIKPKKYTYHKSHSYKTKEGVEVNFLTQLYSIGIYAIVNNDAQMQLNLTPSQLVNIEKKLKKQEEKGNITNLKFGTSITVINNNDDYKELKDDKT